MKIADALAVVGASLQTAYGALAIPRAEIVARVVALVGCDPSSVIPSDHCCNRLNTGVLDRIDPMFVHDDSESAVSGSYRFIGRNAKYNGPIYHHSKHSDQVRQIGAWVDGRLHLHHDKQAQ